MSFCGRAGLLLVSPTALVAVLMGPRVAGQVSDLDTY